MSNVKLVLELDKTMASNLRRIKTKFEKGVNDTLVIDDTVCSSKVMSLVLAWMAYNQDGEDVVSVAGACGGQVIGSGFETSDENDHFILFVLKQGIPVLIELIEATIKLEVWPLFELACKTMVNQIKDKSVAGVRKLLQLDNGPKISIACIKGFAEYLPILKALELDAIDLKEWQLASNSIWSEQRVLYFGNTTPINEKQCDHCDGTELELNRIECSNEELTANLESIKTSRRRKLPEKFLSIIRRCINLEAIIWDTNFGQMADTKFARVLEQNCPHLVHIEGWIKKEFEFLVDGSKCLIQPASFLDVFESNKKITCFLVKYDDQLTKVQKIKLDYELSVSKVDSRLNRNDMNIIKADNDVLEKVTLYVSSRTALVCGECRYLVDKIWFDKMKNFNTVMPGKVDNGPILNIVNGEYELKKGLKTYGNYHLVDETGWKSLVASFGLINSNHVIKRYVVENPISKTIEMEIYELELLLSSDDKPGEYLPRKVSFAVKYDDLVKQMKMLFCINDKRFTNLRINFELVEKNRFNGGFNEHGKKDCYNFQNAPKYLKDKDIVTIGVK